jgi:hypothetical protein
MPDRLIMPYELIQCSSTPCTTETFEPVVVKESERSVGPSYIEFACELDPIWCSSQNVGEQKIRDRNRTDSRSSYNRINFGRSHARGGETETEIDCTLDETRKECAQNIP